MYLKFLIFGVITALPYVVPELWFLPWISLSPIVYMLIKNGSEIKKRKAYLLGLCFGMGYFGLTYHWFTSFYPMTFLGLGNTESILLIAVCWIGLTLLQATEFGFVPLLYRIIRPDKSKPWLCALTFSAIWVIFEWQENLFWRGVPWARLALTQAKMPVLQQSASLFGSLFVSGIIAVVASFFAAAVYSFKDHIPNENPKHNKKNTILFSSTALALFTLNMIFGAVRMAIPYKTEGEPFGAAVIQGNISSTEKWHGTTARSQTEHYINLTAECVTKAMEEKGLKVELVVWPETVVVTDISHSESIAKLISETSKELQVTILVGAFDTGEDSNGNTLNYNAIYAFYPDGSMDEERYHKQRLVPFGEFTPMEPIISALFPMLSDMNILSDPYTPGKESTVFTGAESSDVKYLGSLICFDSIYETLTLGSVRAGAQVMTLSTNDSWFSDSAAVYQHNRHACLRAIESGRYLVRAANTGISSIISPNGEILIETEPLVEAYESYEICRISSRTLYSYVGNLIVYLCIAFYAGSLVFSRSRKYFIK